MKTLLVPAIAIGNVGQLALDAIYYSSSLLGGEWEEVEVLDNGGYLQGSCVGRSSSSTQLVTSLSLVTLKDRQISLLLVRAPVLPGKSRLFARYILALARQRGFDRVLVVGGASALALTDETDFYANRHVPRFFSTKEEERFPRLRQQDVSQLRLAGLLPFYVQEAEDAVQVDALVLYVFEGENAADGERLARDVCQYLL